MDRVHLYSWEVIIILHQSPMREAVPVELRMMKQGESHKIFQPCICPSQTVCMCSWAAL